MSIDQSNIKILQTLTGHRSDVTSCDFGANFTLITGSSDKTVRIWDWIVGSGYVERSSSPLRDHKYQVTCVRISPQGTMFASASVDGSAILWNLHSTTKLHTMTQVNGDAIRVCRFAPDSSVLVTGGDNGAVCVWDLIHRGLIRTIFQHEGAMHSLGFTPDSQYLVSACSLEVVHVWYVQDIVDTTSEELCSSLARFDNAHDLGVFCLDIRKTISVDDNNPLVKYYTMATSGNSNDIKIWTITSIATLKSKNTSNEVSIEYCDTYDGHSSSVTCIRYSNNGRYLVSSSLDKTVRIWDHDGNCIANLEGHTRYVNCATISKDSILVASGSTGSNDKLMLIWDLSGELSFDSELFKPHRLSLSNDELPELHLMRQTNEDQVRLLEKIDDISEGAINCCCFNKDGILATASGDKLVKLFKVMEENNNVEETCSSPLEGHTYAVNHVEFSRDGTKLASCSLDGYTYIWNPMSGEKISSVLPNSLSIRVCRFSPNDELLITAGDDEIAYIWNNEATEQIATLEGHLDAITSACFTPDSKFIVTTSLNADFRLWKVDEFENIFLQDDAHDGGIQNCDFSPNLDPIPNVLLQVQSYLLCTCGNDSFVKLWRVSLGDNQNECNGELEVKLWRLLKGHGGNVICVRFSPEVGEIICSTATDRQARIWSVYSAECLHVLDHDSIVTSCAFSFDCSLIAIGCIDRTLWLWKLPQQLVFQTIVANKIKCRNKSLVDWTVADVTHWLKNMMLEDIIGNAENASLDGQKILTLSESQICSGLDLDEEQTKKLTKELRWLKQNELQILTPTNVEIPHEFLCPITHEIMREPVTCSDGFTYEKHAIAEWFMSGKYTSPLTNEMLTNTDYTYNQELRNAIQNFLDNISE